MAENRFPGSPVESGKAWAEMTHRYFAASLGLLIFAILAMTVVQRRRNGSGSKEALALPLGLAVLVVCQAAFGMWTVTLKLWPQIVTGHLLGGFATLGLLWLGLTSRGYRVPCDISFLRPLSLFALGLLIVQITLGGWTSSNYAALACPDFPTCQGQWWPDADFDQGLNVTQQIGPNYLGGMLDSSARIAIHLLHRLGALGVLLAVGWLSYRLGQQAEQRKLARVMGGLLGLQVALGVSNIVFSLPLAVATAHNGVAALLLLSLITVNYRTFYASAESLQAV